MRCWLTMALLCAVVPAASGQVPVPQEPPAVQVTWFEVVPFAAEVDASFWRVKAGAAAGEQIWSGEEGPAVVCNGVLDTREPAAAVHCRPRYLQPGDLLQPALTPGVAVTGQLLAEREPVVGAKIRVTLADLEARKPFLLPLHLAEDAAEPGRDVATDAEGRFLLPPLGAGMYRLEVQAPGGRIELLDAFSVPDSSVTEPALQDGQPESPPAQNPVLDLGEISLPLGLTLRFTVSSATGEALAGARVSALQSGGSRRLVFSGKANTEGEAVLRGLDPDLPTQALCRATGFAHERLNFETPPAEVHCFLDPLAGLLGRVAADDEPVSEALVSFELPSPFPGGLPEHLEVPVDEKGDFEILELQPATYTLVVAAPGYRVEQREVRLQSGEVRELETIELTPAAELWGEVRDARSGEPVPGAELFSTRPPGAVRTVSDESGEFLIAAESEQAIRLRVLADGYPPQSVELPTDPAQVEPPFVIELAKGGWIDVLAYREDTGEPCVGCSVVHDLAGGDGLQEAVRGSGALDSAGQVRFGPLPVGRHHVILEEVRSEGSTVTVTSGDNMELADVLSGETVHVVFGSPARNLQLQVWPAPVGWELKAEDGGSVRVVPLGGDNTFTLRYRGRAIDLRLTRPGTSVYLLRVPANYDRPDLEVDLPGSGLWGALPGAREIRLVSTTDPSRTAWTVPAPDGSFEVPHLAPGSYQLLVDGNPLRVISLADGESVSLQDLGVETELSPSL